MRDILRGTLDLLILRVLALEPMHGWGISERIEWMSGEVFIVNQGSLYPALNRMEDRGLIDSEWGISLNNRRAKFYRLTDAGVRRLAGETHRWTRIVEAVSNVLGTRVDVKAITEAAHARGVPVLVDGFISTAGALIAGELAPLSKNYMI